MVTGKPQEKERRILRLKGELAATASIPRRWWKNRKNLLRLVVLGVIVLIVVVVFVLRDTIKAEVVGYPLVALLSFLGSATVLVPVPGLASICVATGKFGLNPIGVALLAGTCQSAGELVGYSAGMAGRELVNKGKVYQRINRWMRGRRVAVVLLIFALSPNPFFDVAGIAAGANRYPVWKFLGLIWVGKSIKSLIIAYVCYLGLSAF